MSFWGHLEVLRWAVVRVLSVFAALFVAVFALMPHIFSAFVLGPAKEDFFVYRFLASLGGDAAGFGNGFRAEIVNINVAAQLMTHLNVSMTVAAVLAFPYLVWELWRYVRPALYPGEIASAGKAFAGGTAMFYLGCTAGYLVVFPVTFRFLAEYSISVDIVNQISLQSYIGYFTMTILIMGLVFEMPVVAWLLSRVGLLDRKFLKKYRRHAVVALLVLAALITPSGDPFTLFTVFLPLYLLYELSVFVVGKEREKTGE